MNLVQQNKKIFVLFPRLMQNVLRPTLAKSRSVGRNVNRPFSYRNLGIRSWELHHENRRDALFTKIWVRRLNSLILKGLWRGWVEVDWGRLRSRQCLGHSSTHRSLLKLRITTNCNFFHALPRGSGRRAQLQENYAILGLTMFKSCRFLQGRIVWDSWA